ncbi:MAG: hypothetical protein ISS47_08480 [Candidatus Omnitrophica bacterium]|nr:hypothetical protein [Candidatus Omnitrophota bacterium]
MPTTIQSLLIVILFIMPGFIISKVISLLVPFLEKEKSEGGLILQALTFSCINYALFFWLILLLYEQKNLWWLLSIIVLILAPILIGYIASKIIKKTFLNVTLTASAWDYYFSGEEPAWILITLKDGTRIGGFFSKNSFVSTGGCDIYIEEVWKIEQGKFVSKIENTDGCIVKNEEIKYIEFFQVVPKQETKNGR